MVKVADETWLATALLHREHPDRADFTISEIVERAEREKLTPKLRPGVRVHATTHCVAELAPSPARLCMLHVSGPGRRRLFQPGDPIHPARAGGKTAPHEAELPEAYRALLAWYERDYLANLCHQSLGESRDPLLELRGSGRETWADEHADEYIERLRSEWS
jgi:hypothetical protein